MGGARQMQQVPQHAPVQHAPQPSRYPVAAPPGPTDHEELGGSRSVRTIGTQPVRPQAMGGGVAPIGAGLGSERVMGGYDDVPTGSTWSWLPWACAAALATLDAYERGPGLENVRELEQVGGQRLAAMADRFAQIGETRATGGFQAIEFVRDRESRERDPELQHLAARKGVERGGLMDSSSTSLNVLSH